MQIFINDTSANPKLLVIVWNKIQISKWNDFKKKSGPKSKALAVLSIGFKKLRE